MLTSSLLAVAALAGRERSAAAAIGRMLGGWRRPHDRASPRDEAQLCRAIAAELRAGASLRSAVTQAAARIPHVRTQQLTRRIAAGLPLGETAPILRVLLPVNGRLAAAALSLAGGSGGRTASLFDALADRASAELSLHRERRALTAQSRFTALVIGGVPLVATFLMAVTGRLASLLGRGQIGAAALGLGLALEVAGLGSMVVMMRRPAVP